MERKITVFLLVGLIFVIHGVRGNPCDNVSSCQKYGEELKTISNPTIKQVCDAHNKVRRCFGDCKVALNAYDRTMEALIPGFAETCAGCINKPGVLFVLIPALLQIMKKFY